MLYYLSLFTDDFSFLNIFSYITFRTGAAIVTSFFYNKRHVLFYVCDTTDKHEAARHRKFKSWFQKYADTESLELLTERIEVEETTFFISFIYNKKHEEAAALQSSFYSYFQELRSKLE